MADLILLIHAVFIAFVFAGLGMLVAGYQRRRPWVERRPLRLVHLAAIGFVVVQTWLGQWCPLTLLENEYRLAEGSKAYGTSFIEHWLGRLIYYDLPPAVFVGIYTVFGLAVLLINILIEHRRRNRRCISRPMGGAPSVGR